MIQTIISIKKVRHSPWAKFRPLIYHGARDICENCGVLDFHLWAYVGPRITTQAVDPLWIKEHGYDSNSNP